MAQGKVGAHCCDTEAVGGVRMQCLSLGRIIVFVAWEGWMFACCKERKTRAHLPITMSSFCMPAPAAEVGVKAQTPRKRQEAEKQRRGEENPIKV